jgi:hypothetical protein
LRLYDCAPITDGAAALVLSADKTDVRISGVGQGTGPLSLRERAVFTSFPATVRAAERAYAMAQVAPQDIDFAEVHDAFTPFEIITTEDLGFFPPGKGGEAVLRGDTAIDGRLPVNPSGGLKARGHPVGASGLAQVVEATKTLRGQGPLKREMKRGITQSTGGLATNNFVTPLAFTRLLTWARKHANFAAIYAGLPASGKPGTLKDRFVGTPAATAVHAKTGSISGVNTLSGFVERPDGQVLVFSVLANHQIIGGTRMLAAIDSVVVELARP